jgi:hypothetical protein
MSAAEAGGKDTTAVLDEIYTGPKRRFAPSTTG